MLISKYGNVHGIVPQTVGKMIWVGGARTPTTGNTVYVNGESVTSSDNNSGLSPMECVASIAKAVSIAEPYDTIILMSEFNILGATVTIDVPGLQIVGMANQRNGAGSARQFFTSYVSSQQFVLSGHAFNVTAAYVRFENVCIEAPGDTASYAINVSPNGGAEIVNCCILSWSPSGGGIKFATDTTGSIANTSFHTYQNMPMVLVSSSVEITIEDCQFTAAAAIDKFISVLGSHTVLISGCSFVGNGTIGAGVLSDGSNTAHGIHVFNCRFGANVTVPIDGFVPAECEIAENYKMGVGAGDGGTLITAIT